MNDNSNNVILNSTRRVEQTDLLKHGGVSFEGNNFQGCHHNQRKRVSLPRLL